MSALRNVPISRKFLLAFSLVCLMCLGLGTYTFVTLHSTSVSSTDLSEDTLPSVIYLGKVELAIDRTRRWDLGTMLCQTPKCTAEHKIERQKALDDYETNRKAYEPYISYPGERELYQKYTAAFLQYTDTSNRGMALLDSGKAGAREKFSAMSPRWRKNPRWRISS